MTPWWARLIAWCGDGNGRSRFRQGYWKAVRVIEPAGNEPSGDRLTREKALTREDH